MQTYIALLRGINVGGHKKIPMAELRELLTKSGFDNVQTYIQSGNVIFQTSNTEAELQIQNLILEHFGFEVPVIVKTREELLSIFDACPLSNEKKEKSYFVLLNEAPDAELLKTVEHISYENEEWIIKNYCLYFYSSIGYGNSKFNMNTFEKKLKVIGTSRNYNTMVKLLSLSED